MLLAQRGMEQRHALSPITRSGNCFAAACQLASTSQTEDRVEV